MATNIEAKLAEAVQLRNSGDKEGSRRLLLELLKTDPTHAQLLYQCAWTHDSMGLETEAVEYYQRAIQEGLNGGELADAYLGLGSTLRALGEYERALETLEKGIAEFPHKRSLHVFWAMALYNNGRTQEAMTDLIRLLVETTSDREIKQYERAILLYANDLDRKWE